MNHSPKRHHMIDFIFPVLLFFLFAISAVTVLLVASNIYKNTTEQSSSNHTARTSLSYISEKVHQSDANGNIHLETIDGTDVLVIDQDYQDTAYQTCIYFSDDHIKELFTKAGTDVSLSSGTDVIEVSDLSMENVNDHLIRISCTDAKGETAATMIGIKTE